MGSDIANYANGLTADLVTICNAEGGMMTIRFHVYGFDRTTRPAVVLPNSACVRLGEGYHGGHLIVKPPILLQGSVFARCKCSRVDRCNCRFQTVSN